MAAEPDFCRDILETRIKGILREHLKISRDITFLQVIFTEYTKYKLKLTLSCLPFLLLSYVEYMNPKQWH